MSSHERHEEFPAVNVFQAATSFYNAARCPVDGNFDLEKREKLVGDLKLVDRVVPLKQNTIIV